MKKDRMRAHGLAVAVLGAAAAALTGCGGGGSAPAVPRSSTAVDAPLSFRLDPPATSAATAARRAPRYLSPATTQIVIDVKTAAGGAEAAGFPVTSALALTSGSCTSSLLTYSCQLAVPSVPAGVAYLATVTTKDASGAVLSASSATFTVVANTNNVVGLTLSGVPAAIRVAAGGTGIVGTSTAGLTLYGTAAQPITVSAVDADGDFIIGPGAPTMSVAMTGGASFTVAPPTSTTPNTFTIQPPGTNRAVASFTATAVYGDGTCSLTGAVCSTSFTIANDVQTLFVMDTADSLVKAFPLPLPATPTAISTSGAPTAVACDAGGTLYVATSNSVRAYGPPYTGSPIATYTSGLNGISAITIDRFGHLFVSNANASTVVEFAALPSTATLATIFTDGPAALTTDAAGDLFVAISSPAAFQEYEPVAYGGVVATTATLTQRYQQGSVAFGSVRNLALDPAGTLIVSDVGTGYAFAFAPPYTGSGVTVTTALAASPALALDAKSDLFVPNGSTGVEELASPYTLLNAQITNGISNSVAYAVDGAGTFYAASATLNTISAYVAPYTGAPTTVSVNVGGNASGNPVGAAPQSLAITP